MVTSPKLERARITYSGDTFEEARPWYIAVDPAPVIVILLFPLIVWVEENTGSSTRPELLGLACDGSWDSKDLTEEKFVPFSEGNQKIQKECH